MMKRAAVNPELAGHPFRRTLPAHVLRPLPRLEPEVEQAMASDSLRSELRSLPVATGKISLQDVKDFLLAYCVCFIAFSAFIL